MAVSICLRHRVRGSSSARRERPSRRRKAAWCRCRLRTCASPRRAVAISRARTGSTSWTSCAASTKTRCASVAEPMLTSMCPRRRAMSHSSSGSVPLSLAAANRRRASVRLAARPSAPGGGEHRARPAAPGPGTARPLARTPPAPRRSPRAEGRGTRRARGPLRRPGPGRRPRRPGARSRGPGHRRRRGPRPGLGARVDGLRPWRPGRSPNGPGGDAPRTCSSSTLNRPTCQGFLQRLLVRPKRSGCPSQNSRVTGVVGSREQQHRLHRCGQPSAAVEERLLDMTGQVQLRGQASPSLAAGPGSARLVAPAGRAGCHASPRRVAR